MSEFSVLLIDDEEELVSPLVERLSFRNIEAEYALSGYDALEKMRGGNFHVVVLDLKMPGMDGLEVLERLQKEHPDIPVLLITGHGSAVDTPKPKPEGAFDYLVKPVDIEDLITKMREAVSSK